MFWRGSFLARTIFEPHLRQALDMASKDLDIHPKAPVNGDEGLSSADSSELVVNGPNRVVFPEPRDKGLFSVDNSELVVKVPKNVVIPKPQGFHKNHKGSSADSSDVVSPRPINLVIPNPGKNGHVVLPRPESIDLVNPKSQMENVVLREPPSNRSLAVNAILNDLSQESSHQVDETIIDCNNQNNSILLCDRTTIVKTTRVLQQAIQSTSSLLNYWVSNELTFDMFVSGTHLSKNTNIFKNIDSKYKYLPP